MYKYVSPELKVTLFDSLEVMCASNTEAPTAATSSTKQNVTGDGPGIVLPDDDF